MYERDGETIYNTALVISPQGEIVAHYRKMFPWLPYEAGTTAGDTFCVFDVPEVGRFGLVICYDMWFPEVCRTLAWMGAEVIIQPTMTPTSDRALELVLAQSNAIFNQCYFLSVNGVGPYGGGQSQFVDPDGRILQRAPANETILTEILDLDRVTVRARVWHLGAGADTQATAGQRPPFPAIRGGQSAPRQLCRAGAAGLSPSSEQPLRSGYQPDAPSQPHTSRR